MNRYEKLFSEMLDYLDYSIIDIGEGIYRIEDLQLGNGAFLDGKYHTAAEVMNRLDSAMDAYFFEPIGEDLKDIGVHSFHYDYSIIEHKDKLPDRRWDFAVLEMVAHHIDEVELKNVAAQEEDI